MGEIPEGCCLHRSSTHTHTHLLTFDPLSVPPTRSKYRPQSTEPQTDGLSLSTTADGSQPNVRKLCDTPPPAPQAHTQNLAYYDNIICQVRPRLRPLSPLLLLLLFVLLSSPRSLLLFSSQCLYLCPATLYLFFYAFSKSLCVCRRRRHRCRLSALSQRARAKKTPPNKPGRQNLLVTII